MATVKSKGKTFKTGQLIYDLSSEDYHGLEGTYSSSQIKKAAESQELFHANYIAKTVAKQESGAFSLRTAVHTGILEPKKWKSDVVVWPGIRRGEEYQKFQKANADKAILTNREYQQALDLVAIARRSEVLNNLLSVGDAEASLFILIRIIAGEIFAPEYNMKLTPFGWTRCACSIKGQDFILKVRADHLADEFILDVKTTSGDARNEFEMARKISYYNYDLSAAMYLDLFSLVRPDVKQFLWTFVSKDFLNCKTYIASEKNIMVGRAKFRHGLLQIADGFANNWSFPDTLGTLEPQGFECDWLTKDWKAKPIADEDLF